MDARESLIAELREHALVIGKVTLASGREAEYYVDAKRATLRPAGFAAMGALVAAEAGRLGATAVGGLTMGADPIACSALAAGADVKAFFVRKEVKGHGLQRRIEGPPLDPGDRCLIVEDVVTSGGSTLQAIEAVREAGHEIVGVVAVLDRLAGGAEAITEGRGRRALYPARNDRRRIPGPARRLTGRLPPVVAAPARDSRPAASRGRSSGDWSPRRCRSTSGSTIRSTRRAPSSSAPSSSAACSR